MTTTIQVDPQTAQALADHAASLGLTIEEFLKKHFAGAKRQPGNHGRRALARRTRRWHAGSSTLAQ